jgi:hypothetical protein
VRTNNHVERVSRRLRYFEKVRYKWRRRRTIVRFVILALDRWRQRWLATHKGRADSSTTRLQSNQTRHRPKRPAGIGRVQRGVTFSVFFLDRS